jgi:hypothetical protein
LAVRIIYDHRVMDGATVARALARLDQVLNQDIANELRSLAGKPTTTVLQIPVSKAETDAPNGVPNSEPQILPLIESL